jgi:hypothetical protein
MLSDSAVYQGKIIDFCEFNGIEFAIGKDLDEAVVKLTNKIPTTELLDYETGKIK